MVKQVLSNSEKEAVKFKIISFVDAMERELKLDIFEHLTKILVDLNLDPKTPPDVKV